MRSSDAPSSCPAPKAKSSAKVKASAKSAVTRRQTSAASARADSNASVQKVAVGNAGKKRSATDAADRVDMNITNSPDKKKSRDAEGITTADSQTLELFESKVNVLKVVSPPVADGPFKSYINDHLSKTNQVIQELRVKRKSAERRTGVKTQTNKADMEFLQLLSKIDGEVKEMAQLLRCT